MSTSHFRIDRLPTGLPDAQTQWKHRQHAVIRGENLRDGRLRNVAHGDNRLNGPAGSMDALSITRQSNLYGEQRNLRHGGPLQDRHGSRNSNASNTFAGPMQVVAGNVVIGGTAGSLINSPGLTLNNLVMLTFDDAAANFAGSGRTGAKAHLDGCEHFVAGQRRRHDGAVGDGSTTVRISPAKRAAAGLPTRPTASTGLANREPSCSAATWSA